MDFGIPISGMRAAGVRMQVTSNNIANWISEDYKANRVYQHEGVTGSGTTANVMRTDQPTDIASDFIESHLSLRYMQANTAVVKRYDEMIGSLINMWA